MKINLLDLDYAALERFVCEEGLPRFRAKQINEWLLRGTERFEEMTDLPASLRETLSEKADPGLPELLGCACSQIDETRKYLFRLRDSCVIESVLMKYKYGYSACISSQAGCRMGCSFCASTGIAFSRNLTTGELLGQILAMNRHAGVKIGHIVMMGIGEPLDNLDNVLRFLTLVNHPDGMNIGLRHISLSTCGLIKKIVLKQY